MCRHIGFTTFEPIFSNICLIQIPFLFTLFLLSTFFILWKSPTISKIIPPLRTSFLFLSKDHHHTKQTLLPESNPSLSSIHSKNKNPFLSSSSFYLKKNFTLPFKKLPPLILSKTSNFMRTVYIIKQQQFEKVNIRTNYTILKHFKTIYISNYLNKSKLN